MDPATRARELHSTLPVVDGHNDLVWALRVKAGGDLDLADPRGRLDGFHTDVPRLIAGGVGAQFWSVYVPTDVPDPHRMTLGQIDLAASVVERDDRLMMAPTVAELERARAAGKVASLLGAEGGHCIEGSLDKLAELAQRGVRYLTLTHSDSTEWADSATGERLHGGLTDFGRSVVSEMNRLGVIVDISHVSEETMRDALDASAAPVVASHSNARALAAHPRNLPDDVLRTLGRRGGVAMAVFFPGFVVDATARAMVGMFDTARAIRARLAGDEQAISRELERVEASLDVDRGTVADVVDHIEHMATVAGIDAVGLGSDFDGMSITVEGLEDVSCYPRITEELFLRGWSEDDVCKVLGGNAVRVLADVEAVARR